MKGQIKIRLGNDNQEPMVVYVKGFNENLQFWVCEKLNSGDSVFSKESQLIDFNHSDFKRMFYEWKIKNQDVVKARFVELLNELPLK
jgi:hypothetical protein